MVDVDAAELAKLSDVVQMPICADAGSFLREMLAQKASIACADRRDWKARCKDWKSRYPIIHDEHRGKGPVSIYHLAEVISQTLSRRIRLSPEVPALVSRYFFSLIRSKTGQRVFHTAGLGAMGFGIAASIGVSLATGRSRTICVDGDGGFQMNIQELATVAHHRLPLKFFVLNNGGYAAIRGSQNSFFGGANIGCDSDDGIDPAGSLRSSTSLWYRHRTD